MVAERGAHLEGAIRAAELDSNLPQVCSAAVQTTLKDPQDPEVVPLASGVVLDGQELALPFDALLSSMTGGITEAEALTLLAHITGAARRIAGPWLARYLSQCWPAKAY